MIVKIVDSLLLPIVLFCLVLVASLSGVAALNHHAGLVKELQLPTVILILALIISLRRRSML